MFASAYPAIPMRPVCASEIIPPYAERKMRLAAPMPRMSACVRIEFSQKSLKMSGASTATTSAPTPIARSTAVLLAASVTPLSRRNSPCGRNASTSAIRTNVSTTEYCVQHSFPVTGR